MPLKNLFPKFRPGSEQQRQFAGWPSAPLGFEVPAGPVGDLVAQKTEPTTSERFEKFSPTMVIGLGQSGAIVIKQWLEQVEQQSWVNVSDTLRPILITQSSVAFDRSLIVPIWQYELEKNNPASNRGVTKPRETPRERIHRQYREAAGSRPLGNYVQACLRELHGNIRVFVVGSLSEVEIGLIGDVLQVLHQTRGSNQNPYLFIAALLTVETPGYPLDLIDVYPALREIGRFTFGGMHWIIITKLPVSGDSPY